MFQGYITEIPPESDQARQQRHEIIAQKRNEPVVLVHRGAASLATENTLEAYAASMDYGADGCEIDIRRTLDGVLVMFHDDYLDRLSQTVGVFDQLTYDELKAVIPKDRYGTLTEDSTLPTLAAVFTLARQRNMLLHLDIKKPGLEEEIIELLDEADIWDHIVSVNDYNSEKIRADARCQPLQWVRELYQQRFDADPEKCREYMPPPGKMVILDDPRVMAMVLERPAYQPVALPEEVFVDEPEEEDPYAIEPVYPASVTRNVYVMERNKAQYSEEQLVELLEQGPENDWKVIPSSDEKDEVRIERILERGWAARQLGEMDSVEKDTVDRLVFIMEHRSLHPEWMYHGLDGSEAARALGKLGYKEVVPMLIDTFKSVDPALREIRGPQSEKYPLAFTDWRIKESIIQALGDIQKPQAKEFLLWYIQLSKEEVEKYAPDYRMAATTALLQYALSDEELVSLLTSENSRIRGTAILYVLDRGTKEQYQLLIKQHPWAEKLPRGKGFETK